jgi:peroxiredoxin
MPALALPSTDRDSIDLSDPGLGAFVLFLFPRTGDPATPDSPEWELLPGAKGCTAEACRFRDLATDFRRAGHRVFGASSQDIRTQREATTRLALGYPLLSDPELLICDALGLETFAFEGTRMFVRATLIVEAGRIQAVYRRIANPREHPLDVLTAVRARRTSADVAP